MQLHDLACLAATLIRLQGGRIIYRLATGIRPVCGLGTSSVVEVIWFPDDLYNWQARPVI